MDKKKKKLQCSINKDDIQLLQNTDIQDFIQEACDGKIEIIQQKTTLNKQYNVKIFIDELLNELNK